MSPEAIDALVAAGVSVEQLAAAVKAELVAERASAAACEEERRAKAREKKRRQRISLNVPGTDRDNAGQTGTDGDASPPEVPPKDNTQTPLLPSPPEKVRASAIASSDWPSDGFEQFYGLYPRKKGRADAERAYRKVERRPGLTFARLMAGVQRLIESGPDPQFTPYPASWLNAGQFDDEPDVLAFRQPGAHHGNRPRPPNASDSLTLAFARSAGLVDERGGIRSDDPPGSDGHGASGGGDGDIHALLRIGSR